MRFEMRPMMRLEMRAGLDRAVLDRGGLNHTVLDRAGLENEAVSS